MTNSSSVCLVPVRGDADPGQVLTDRNKANAKVYDSLEPDEHDIFTSPIFYALGGYPDYGALSVEDNKTCGDFDVLIPEVPKLSDEDEARYRPIYERLVDPAKVAKDRERTMAPSASKMEKRSLQAFKSRIQQVTPSCIFFRHAFQPCSERSSDIQSIWMCVLF